jgi:hypothetical protein
MTVNQLVSDIRNIATSGSNPIEFKIEDSQILYWCDQIRSTLISQDISKRKDISDVWIQIISCLELEQVDASECCEITTDCYVLRTKREIPLTIETWMNNGILKVTTPDGKPMIRSNPFKVQYSLHNKFGSNKAQWYYKNKRIYIINEQLLETINVWGIFDNPTELSTFVSCGGNTCFSYDSEYPCSNKMASNITDIVLKTKVFPFLQLPADNTNDAVNKPDGQVNTKGL